MGFLEDRAGLSGKVAAVIGGGGGLGGGIARDFARAGVHLALADRDGDRLAACKDEAAASRVRVVDRVLDAREPSELESFFSAVRDQFGALDILVNVVGGVIYQPFSENRPKGWDALYRANYQWLLHATSFALPLLRATGRGGSIIHLTSIEAHRAAPNYAVYSGFKAAVTNYTRSLALELAPEGIRVNTIEPDLVPTESIRAMAPDDGRNPWDDTPVGRMQTRLAVPMARVGTLEDIGNCALFLASDLSSYITGTQVHPDGGTTASAGWFNWPGRGWSNFPPASVAELFLDSAPPAGPE